MDFPFVASCFLFVAAGVLKNNSNGQHGMSQLPNMTIAFMQYNGIMKLMIGNKHTWKIVKLVQCHFRLSR